MDINAVYHNLVNSQPDLIKTQLRSQIENIISLCEQSEHLFQNDHPEHIQGLLKIIFQEFTNFIVLVEFEQAQDKGISFTQLHSHHKNIYSQIFLVIDLMILKKLFATIKLRSKKAIGGFVKKIETVLEKERDKMYEPIGSIIDPVNDFFVNWVPNYKNPEQIYLYTPINAFKNNNENGSIIVKNLKTVVANIQSTAEFIQKELNNKNSDFFKIFYHALKVKGKLFEKNMVYILYFSTLISYFRDLKEKIPEEIRNFFGRRFDLSAPVSLDVFWIEKRGLSSIGIFCNKNDEKNDTRIRVHGPANIEQKNQIDELEISIKQTSETIDNIDKSIFENELLEKIRTQVTNLNSLVKQIEKNPNHSTEGNSMSRMNTEGLGNSFFYIHTGSFFSKDPYSFVLDLYHEAVREKDMSERMTGGKVVSPGIKTDFIETGPTIMFQSGENDLKMVQDATFPKESTIKTQGILWYGATINPQIWIGDEPDLDFSTSVLNPTIDRFISIIKKFKVRHYEVEIYNNGLLKIRDTNHKETYETKENKAEMLTIFNTFFAASMVTSEESDFLIPFDRYQLSHFIQMNEDDETQGLQISYSGYSDKNLDFPTFDPFERGISEVIQFSKKITLDGMNLILSSMQKIMEKDYLIILADLVVKSYTHKLYKEEIQSFLISWMVIEEVLSQKYNNYLKEKDFDDDLLDEFDRDLLVKKINRLKKMNQIEDETLKKVDSMRIKRNKLIHKLEIIDNGVMDECFSIALEFLKGEIK